MTTVSIVLCIAIVSWNVNAIEVSTSLGTIRGVVLKSRLGKDFNAFRGIRYGKSPVGDLRFKNPQPAEAWKPNTFDATVDGPQCPQKPFNSTDNSEDCLRLNVYTKNLYPKILKPVVVYIHPGEYYEFSALSKSFAGPEFLMDRDIVLVTIGYRLGALGLLSTGTPDAPGNAGLKDQVLALRWVNQHINNFGGDPNSVTLLSYSAGSVGFHMISPMSKGLFHRGIAMNSSPMTSEIYPESQLDLAKKQAELINCPSKNLHDMMQCLRKAPAEEFVKTFHDLYNFGFLLLQVIEKDHGQERFLVEEPTEAFQEGRFQRTPLIVGMTNDEFVRIVKSMLQDKTLNDEEEPKSSVNIQFERNTPRSKSKHVITVLRNEYLQNQTLSNDIRVEAFEKLVSDADDVMMIGFPVHRFVHLAARYVPVYYYRFSYKGRFSDFLYPPGTAYGSVYHDALWYLLQNSYISSVYEKSDPEDKIIERLTRIVSQFAKTGNPNDPEDEYLKAVDWKTLDLKENNFLKIGDDLVMNEGLFLERFDIWKLKIPDGDGLMISLNR